MRIRNIIISGLLLLVSAAGAQAGEAPDFMPALYGDGEVWSTKFAAALPGPRGRNQQSFDGLFIVLNGVEGQMPVAEAAPGNPAYNGGRWDVHQVMWIDGTPYLLTSYEDILSEEAMGNLMIVHGTFPDGPPQYFLCPMLPVK
jgi:hypothetical protein